MGCMITPAGVLYNRMIYWGENGVRAAAKEMPDVLLRLFCVETGPKAYDGILLYLPHVCNCLPTCSYLQSMNRIYDFDC